MGTELFVESFQSSAVAKLQLLEEKGFHRAPELERTTGLSRTVVYLGEHVGFVFSLDIRDQCIDAYVSKVVNGKLLHKWEGGFYQNLFGYLQEHTGYRGHSRKNVEDDQGDQPDIDIMLDRWIELLRHEGKALLEDRPDSLPGAEYFAKRGFERSLARARTTAELAWQEKDYSGVVEAYKPLRNVLTPLECKKLEFAEKQLSR